MTVQAFKDSGDGYYEADVVDGQPVPDWVTKQGLTPTAVVLPVVAPLDQWMSDMANFKLSREVEDLITEGSLSMNEYQKTIYDLKIARRLEKP